MRADDKERLRTAFERLSPQTVTQRFFHPIRELSSAELRAVTEPDFRDQVALAMTVVDEAGERLIAEGRFVRIASVPDCAEVGLTVADEYQHRGAGTLLLRHLVALARSIGIRKLIADVLEGNEAMIELVASSRLPVRQTAEHGICRVVLELEQSERIVNDRPM